MYGYSSFDSYFGVNTPHQMMMNPNMMSMPHVRPESIPGINAPKEHKKETGKVIACLVGAAAAAVLVFKGKAKIGKVFDKLFGREVKSEVSKDAAKTNVLSKIKGFVSNATGFVKKKAGDAKGAAEKLGKKSEELGKVPPPVNNEELQLGRNEVLSVLKEVQNKVNNIPNVDPNAKVGTLLDVKSIVN